MLLQYASMDSDLSQMNRSNNIAPTSGAFFQSAQHFKVESSVFVGHQTNIYHSDIEKLALYIISGASFNSSARDPPPRCHPQTRTAILQRIHEFLATAIAPKRILWLCGYAGVGKSAIVQTVAESFSMPTQALGYRLGTAVFFSGPNNRNDPKRLFPTVAYQLATQSPAYREFIISQLATDPLLCEKSMAEQFRLLLVVPFAERQIDRDAGSLVIMLDGLDECKGDREQVEIITLVSRFIIQHPDVPILWVIASRPEPHIRNAFSRFPTFLEETVPIDSDEACKDVELYLHRSFDKIREDYPECFSAQVQWPSEKQFLTLSTVASGHFALATTAVRFVEDPEYGNPVSRLEEVLAVVDDHSTAGMKGTANPLAALDALYTRILSSISKDILPTTLRILAYNHQGYFESPNFRAPANFWRLGQSDVYSALRKLHSVLSVPTPDLVDDHNIEVYHRSFDDYLLDPERSGSFYLYSRERHGDWLQAGVLILYQAVSPSGHYILIGSIFVWKVAPENILLSWPPLEEKDKTQHQILKNALQAVSNSFCKASEPVRREVLPRLAYILKHLDLVEASSFVGTFGFYRDLYYGFREFLRDVRNRELGSARVVHADQLDSSHIAIDRPCYVFLHETGLEEPSTDKRGFNPLDIISWEGQKRGEPPEVTERGIFCHAVGPLNADGMKQILLDVRSLSVDEPSSEVYIWGFGEKRVILFERKFTVGSGKQICTYIVPYPEP
ncbi:hypothetical protein D9756_008842 [Leucocoprinus leucothites]|uniref:Nephrocystin 3-like N-terminal domain-containing protein n=1 Tax=Leucocoprinus leucothites TaxID=201217 RepID=A0A8H5FUD5_9AGAR|nr:hypothetical protein D9756_008842 [Leucoagaricus leucothites]